MLGCSRIVPRVKLLALVMRWKGVVQSGGDRTGVVMDASIRVREADSCFRVLLGVRVVFLLCRKGEGYLFVMARSG